MNFRFGSNKCRPAIDQKSASLFFSRPNAFWGKVEMGKWGARYFLATSVFALAVAGQASETTTYSYDALGRLTASSSSGTVNNGVTSSVGYDAAGNRSIYAMSVSGAPSFSVSEAAAAEGDSLVFTVVKNGTGAASVSYVTANGSAGGGDYYPDPHR